MNQYSVLYQTLIYTWLSFPIQTKKETFVLKLKMQMI
jgi:hypothetical protein